MFNELSYSEMNSRQQENFNCHDRRRSADAEKRRVRETST